MKNVEKQLKFFKFTSFFLLAIILLGVLFSSKLLSRFCPKPKVEDELIEKAKPSAETEIGKDFEFPIKKWGKENFKIKLVKAVKVKIVTSKGQPITANKGKDFLLVYLEIENNQETPIVIDSQNYFRLQDNEGKKFAPDLLNGPIKIAAISTRKDQVGFIIPEAQKEFKLLVGEIEGKKEEIVFNF